MIDKKPSANTLPSDTCRFCGFDRFTTVLMPEDHAHYAALRCGRCDGFWKWAENPETKEKREQLKQQIEELKRSPLLTAWEKQFLSTVSNQKKLKLTPKQMETIERISNKVGGSL